MFNFLRVWVPTEKEAKALSQFLVKEKLVAGTFIDKWLCHYWWKEELCEKIYWNVAAYTIDAKKEKIVKHILDRHPDECPVVSFSPVEIHRSMKERILSSIW